MREPLDQMETLLKKWHFNWGVMDVLIGGRSSIDLERIRFKNKSEAIKFLKFYGYDPGNPDDAMDIHRVIVEAWNFIQTNLMPKEWAAGRRPPDSLLYSTDASDLLLAASNKDPRAKVSQMWACAALKLMHTIAHIDGVQRMLDVTKARPQIMDRFFDHVFRDNDGQLYFGQGGNAIALHQIEWKDQKSRQSMILKLLHKRANVAETIYDMIGVRIITKDLKDCLLAVKFLRDFHIVTFPNCNPSRAKNTLVDFEVFKDTIENFRDLLKDGKLDPSNFEELIDSSMQPVKIGDMNVINKINPHSGKTYRSIQLTCRQLIRYPDPSRTWLSKLQQAYEHQHLDEHAKQVVEDILRINGSLNPSNRKKSSNDVSGFFPFEIQIVDADTYEMNKLGDANHLNYKQSQIIAARRRILSGLLLEK